MRRALVVALAVSSLAWAQDAKVEVKADVIHAQEKAGTVDPGLEGMQAALAKGKKYGSLKRISTQKITVQPKSAAVSLPNGKTAELSLVTLEKDVATIKVKVPDGETTLKLGRDGSAYQQAGAWQGGDLWLVLGQPR